MQTEVSRALGGMERLFYQNNTVGSTNYCVVLFVEGALNLEGLDEALDDLLRVYPRLGASIVARPNLEFAAALPGLRIPYQILPRRSAEQWRTVGEEETRRQHGEARMLLTVLQGEEASEILIALDHTIADGKSSYAIARALIRCLNGEKLPTYPILPAMEERNPQFFGGFRTWYRAFRFAGRTLKENPVAGHKFGEDVPSFTVTSAGLRLDRDTLGAIKRNADLAAAGLNSALCAACMQSAFAVFGEETAKVMCLNTPANVRDKMIPPASEEELGMFISGILQWHELSGATDVWDLARAIKRGIVTAMAEDAPLKFARLAGAPRKPKPPQKPNRWAARFDHSLTVTNPGRIERLPDIKGAKVAALRILASVWAKESLTFLLQGYGDELFIDVQTSNEKFAKAAKSAKELALELERRLRLMASCTFALS